MKIRPRQKNEIFILPELGLITTPEGGIKLPTDTESQTTFKKALAAMAAEVRSSAMFKDHEAIQEFIIFKNSTRSKKREESTSQRYALTLSQFIAFLQIIGRLKAFKNKDLTSNDLAQYSLYLNARLNMEQGAPLKMSRNTVMSYLTAVRRFYKTWERLEAGSEKPVINFAKHLENPDKPSHVIHEREGLEADSVKPILKNLDNDVLQTKQQAEAAAAEFKRIGYKGTEGRKAEAAKNKTHRKHIEALRNRAIVALMVFEGYRVSTIQELKKGHIIEKRGRKGLLIFEKGKGKTEQNRRETPILHTTAMMLHEYTEALPMDDKAYLFHSLNGMKKGGQLSCVTISQTAKKQLIRVGLTGKQYTAHSLRHTFGTLLAEAEVSLRSIQLKMGHANQATTENYIKLNESNKEWANPSHAVLSEVLNYRSQTLN